MADPKIQISIGAMVDASLAASVSKTKDLLNQLQAAQGQLEASLASSNGQIATNTGNTNRQQLESWKQLCSEITSAEGQLVSEIFSKRQSLAADLEKVGQRLVESEVTNALKTLTTNEIKNIGILQSDKDTMQEGLLYKLGAYLADQMGFAATEVAKTADNDAGVSARNAVQSAGTATGLAEQATAKAAVVESDAAQAASGAYSSASQIPYVGWIIAPAAAAVAYGAVMAFAEGGQLRVGAAMQPTMLHKDEMVWPSWAAHGARNMLASFSAGDFSVPRGGDTFNRSQSDTTTHQWNYAPTIHGVADRDVMGELRNNAAEFASFVRGLSRGGSMKFG